MKLNRYSLRMLIENILAEEEESDIRKFKSVKNKTKLRVSRETAEDNISAFKVTSKAALKIIGKILKISTPKEYFIYADNVDGSVGKLGPVRYDEGDPYTYKEVSKSKTGKRRFRVISGPRDSKKGARPIGVVFTPKSIPEGKVNVEGDDSVDLMEEYTNLCDNLKFKSDVPTDEDGNSVKDAIAALKFFGRFLLDEYLANDQKLPMKEIGIFEQVITAGRNYTGLSGKAARAMGVGMLFAPGIQSKETIINNMLEFNKAMDSLGQIFEEQVDDQEAADIIDSRLFFNPPKQRALQSKVQAAKKGSAEGPAGDRIPGPGESIMAPANESFSRGSLLRRRYRRY